MIYVILQKAKPYTRVKRGKLERVRGYPTKEGIKHLRNWVMNVGKEADDAAKWLIKDGVVQRKIKRISQEFIKRLKNYDPKTNTVVLYRGAAPIHDKIAERAKKRKIHSWSWRKDRESMAGKMSLGVPDWLIKKRFPLSAIVAIPSLAFPGWDRELRESYRSEYEVIVKD